MLADFGQQCEPLTPQDVMQGVGERAPISTKLSAKSCGEAYHGLAVINIEVLPRIAMPAKTLCVAIR